VNVPFAAYGSHVPLSTRYRVARIPVPLGSRTEKERGVEEVTNVPPAVTFGSPTTSVVTGLATTSSQSARFPWT